MEFVSCVKWVKKGVAQKIPESIHLNEEELKNLIESAGDDEIQEPSTGKDCNPDSGDEYDMKNYEEEDDNVRVTLKGIADFGESDGRQSKKRKKKSKKRFNEDDLSDDEKEDEMIRDDDNLLLVGHVNDDLSTIDVYVYNESDGDMYIHHDLILKSPPLCMEWLNIETVSGYTNMCAIGTMDPVIELWDLDLMNCVAPVSKLGRFKKKKNPDKNFGHTDAVLTIAWNAELPHILCSGSVDKTVLLWDLEIGKVATTINIFGDKVQNALWNPHNEYHLLTGCADGIVHNFDCRVYDEYRSIDLRDSVESILWHPLNEHCCYAGTESGDIYALDFRSTVPLFKFKGHRKEVTGLTTDKTNSKTLISVSTDKQLKLWSVDECEAELIREEDYDIGPIHCIDSNPDYPNLVCVGGYSETKNRNVLKVMNPLECEQPKSEKQNTTVNPTLPSGVVLLEGENEMTERKKLKKKKKKHKKLKVENSRSV